jgi:CHAD domain-containing protein
VAKALPIPGIEPDATFREAAASAVEVRMGELFSFAAGVLDTDDIERVHDMRVASRRLRAVLEVFAPCFDKDALKDVLRDVKALADDLGERRDPDVAIETLEHVAAGLAREDRPGIEHLAASFAERQGDGNRQLRRRLEEVESSRLEERLEELAASARDRAAIETVVAR